MRGVIAGGDRADTRSARRARRLPVDGRAGPRVARDDAASDIQWGDPDAPYHIVAYDFGIKRNILRLFAEHDCRVTVVPAETSADEALALEPNGVFLSNGPGDPAAVSYAPDTVRAIADEGRADFRYLPGAPDLGTHVRRAAR